MQHNLIVLHCNDCLAKLEWSELEQTGKWYMTAVHNGQKCLTSYYIYTSLFVDCHYLANLNPPQIAQGQESAQCPLVVNQL